MTDIIKKGQVLSIIVYALYGIGAILGVCLDKGGWDSFAAAMVFFWAVTLVTLTAIRMSTLRHSFAYKALYILSVCVFAISMQLCFTSIFVVFIIDAILWLTVITFLDKRSFRFTIFVQACCILFLVLIPREYSGLQDFNITSWLFSCIGFLVADWVGNIIIGILIEYDEETQEHDRSLDDLLEIVELKHQDAVQATAAKSNFLSNMSHELRTPLNAVIGLDEMILRETQDVGIYEYARDIKASGNMMLSLVNDILDLSKIESNKMTLVTVDFDMKDIVKDIVNMISPKMKEKGLEFNVEADPSLLAGYRGSDVRLKQILVNILNNAAKYTPEGSVTFSISGTRGKAESKLHFSVKDTGMGIKEEDLSKLNKQFVRIDEERNRNIEGTGLGITIVNGLLNLMNSELHVESKYGEGSNFYFDITLPNVDSVENKDGNAASRINEEVFIDKDMEILVVDDNSVNLKVISSLLKRNEVKVDTAESGEEAIEKAVSKKYDIIFLDKMMPVMDGVETLGKMKQIENFVNADTPIIALTADATDGARQIYIGLGFDDYLMKPIEPIKLENTLKKYRRN